MGRYRSSLLLALGAAAWAASPEPPPPPADASATVTVTAEGTPVAVVQTPNPVVVIDRAAIEARGADNLGDLLAAILPGMVFASGGVGTATSLGLGGGRPQDSVVTLDGIRLADASGLGGVNLSFISLAGIERIELQQGPCSTRYGSDAQAGVVALFSAGHAPDGFSGQVRLGQGTQDIQQGAFAPAWGWGSGWVRASLSAQREDGATTADNPYRSSGAFVGLGQQVGTDTLLTLNYVNAFSGVPIPIVYVSAPPRDPSQYVPARQDFSRMEVLSGALRTVLAPALTAELTLGQVLQVRLEPDYLTNAATDRYLSRRNQSTGTLTWKASDATTLQAGFDASGETAFSYGSDPASGRHLALFLEDQWELGPALRLVGSVRQERDRLTFPTGPGASQDDAVNHATWKLGVNWLLGSGFRCYASSGTAFANPLLFQTVYNAQNNPPAQNPPLDNEKSTTTQAGLTFERGPWKAGVELSRTAYGNLIYFNPDTGTYIDQYGGYWTGSYQNGSNLLLQSARFTLGYRTAAWSLEGFYRNQEFRDRDAAAGQEFLNSAVLRRPFQVLGFNGHRTFGRLRLEARWSWTGPRYDYGVPNPGYNASAAFKEHFNDLGVLAAWSLRRNLTLTLRGDHLLQPRTSAAQWLAGARDFQNDASQVYGYPAQPPTGTLEVRYRF